MATKSKKAGRYSTKVALINQVPVSTTIEVED